MESTASGNIIALLIDAENVSPKYIKTIVDEVSMYGTPAYKRIYGDWTSAEMSSWKKVLLEHNLTPIQQFSYTQGKNASDSAMIIDAMDILYTRNVDGFCLVSSDSDFTRLAARLRESRMFVIGMGESKTPTAFKSACDTFKYLDVLMGLRDTDSQKKEKTKPKKQASKAPAAKKKASKKAESPAEPHYDLELAALADGVLDDEDEGGIVPLDTIVDKIQEIIDYDADEDGWLSLSQIALMLSRIYADFDARNYGYSRFHKLIEATGLFETKYNTLPNGSKEMVVRNKAQ